MMGRIKRLLLHVAVNTVILIKHKTDSAVTRVWNTYWVQLAITQSFINCSAVALLFNSTTVEGRKDALNTFYLRLYGVRHMVKDHLDSDKGNPLLPHGLFFPISSRVLLYSSSHRQDNTYHSLCYTSRGALVGMRNNSMDPLWRIDPMTHHPWANTLTMELHLAPSTTVRRCGMESHCKLQRITHWESENNHPFAAHHLILQRISDLPSYIPIVKSLLVPKGNNMVIFWFASITKRVMHGIIYTIYE